LKYFELNCTVYLKKEITFKDSFKTITKYLNHSMLKKEELKELHGERGFKYYSFGNFYPIEKEQVYKKGNSYQFTIRSPNEKFIDNIARTLRENIDNPDFLVVETHKKNIKQFFISELYSATPVVVSVDRNIFWTKEDDLMLLYRQLQDNLEKKYFDLYGEKLEPIQNFIQLLELKNHRLQTIEIDKFYKNGKNVKLFGNKFRIVPNEDEVSQKLAFLALSCSLGEKSSYGAGFLLGKGMRL